MAKRSQPKKERVPPPAGLWTRRPVRASVYAILIASALWSFAPIVENYIAPPAIDFFGSHVQTNLAPEIAVILADEKDNGALGPFDLSWRTRHAELIDTLAASGARVVVFDVVFSLPGPGDREIALAMKRAAAKGTRVILAASGIQGHPVQPLGISIQPLDPGEWGLTKVGAKAKSSGIVRRMQLAESTGASPAPGVRVVSLAPSLALQAVALYRAKGTPVELVRGGGNTIQVEDGNGRSLESIPVNRNLEIPIEMASADAIAAPHVTYRYQDVYRKSSLGGIFGGKIVMVAVKTQADHPKVPGGSQRYGYEVQASVISSLLQLNYVRTPHLALLWLAIPSVAAIFAAAHSRFPGAIANRVTLPLKMLDFKLPVSWLTVGIGIGYLLLAFVLYKTRRVAIEFACPLLALALADVYTAWAGDSAKTIPAKAGSRS